MIKDKVTVDKEPKKESEVSDAVDFLNWIWLNKYTENNDADELYEIFKTKPND